jgi:hypothetical protein
VTTETPFYINPNIKLKGITKKVREKLEKFIREDMYCEYYFREVTVTLLPCTEQNIHKVKVEMARRPIVRPKFPNPIYTAFANVSRKFISKKGPSIAVIWL